MNRSDYWEAITSTDEEEGTAVVTADVALRKTIAALTSLRDNRKQKKISQADSVSAGDRLQVENRYGNITVTHWNQNTVAIRVEVECKARSEERAQENLDRIQIETKKIGGIVSAVTTIKKEMNSNSNNESMTINYYIQMPPKLAADLNQKYGNINLPSDITATWISM